MKKPLQSLVLIFGISAMCIGCLPLSVVGTTSEDVIASRQSQNSEPVEIETTASNVDSQSQDADNTLDLVQEFEIGDRGPAGGFIFYDKGSYADGWRYLEIAPEETEFPFMPWGPGGVIIGETSATVGSGFENTKRIVSVLGGSNSKTGNPYPALLCDQLVYHDHDDWFLPSKDELSLVYQNLISPQKGDFPADNNQVNPYWSSTEDESTGYGSFAYNLYGHNGSFSNSNKDFPGIAARAARRF